MIGKMDYVSDGYLVVIVVNGYEYLGFVMGMGCIFGMVILVVLVVYYKEDKLWVVVMVMLYFEIVVEIVVEREDVKGFGIFILVFLDELYNIWIVIVSGDMKWLERVKVMVMDF